MFEGGDNRSDPTVGMTRDPAAPVTVAELKAVNEYLGSMLAALSPGDVLFSESVELWGQFTLTARLGSAGATLRASRVDDSRRWARAGHRNVDDYLASLAGESVGEARRQREASERLKDLPHTEDELRKGRLSPGQRDAITDGAAANPNAEKDLLDGARKNKPLKDLRDLARRAKAAADPDPDATHDRNHRERKARTWVDADQAFHLHANGSTLDGQPIKTALDRITEDLFQHRRAGAHEPREAYQFDALQMLAENYLGTSSSTPPAPGDAKDAEPGDAPEPGDEAGDEPLRDRIRHGRLKYQVILHADLEALRRGHVEGDERCEIVGLGPIPVNQARAMLGESTLHLVLTKGVDVQNVTYLGHGLSAAQRIALLWTDPNCTTITCPNTMRLENDHREPFANVRCTELTNIDRPCDHCHRLKTYQGWIRPRHRLRAGRAQSLAPVTSETRATAMAEAAPPAIDAMPFGDKDFLAMRAAARSMPSTTRPARRIWRRVDGVLATRRATPSTTSREPNIRPSTWASALAAASVSPNWLQASSGAAHAAPPAMMRPRPRERTRVSTVRDLLMAGVSPAEGRRAQCWF
jgi:hypothetical protein